MAEQQLFFVNMSAAGITGESQKVGHQGWVEAESWHFQMNQTADLALGQAGGTGTAAFGSFGFTRSKDKSSPKFFEYCSTGSHIKTIVFEAERQGTQQAGTAGANPSSVYFRVTMNDVVISGRDISQSEKDRGLESLEFAFAEVEVGYALVMTDGTTKSMTVKKYNAKMNRAQ